MTSAAVDRQMKRSYELTKAEVGPVPSVNGDNALDSALSCSYEQADCDQIKKIRFD